MYVVLVGADLEENLGVGMIAAMVQRAGHRVRVAPFSDGAQTPEVVTRLCDEAPDVVGLSIQFQHRAHEFLALAAELRRRGCDAHITCGGQYPTLAWDEVLAHHDAIDSVVLHEGERAVVELLAALEGRPPRGAAARTALAEVAGLALRSDDGAPRRTAARAIEPDLDALPEPLRYREHSRHVGVPFIPIMGARGCWGSCAFCSITSFYRDARAYGGGKTLRLRSVENIAEEMARLWRAAGERAVFCFHDDTFLLPEPEASLQRVRALREALDARGVGHVGLIGKCRPDSLTGELAFALREAGVLRLYVGVENVSEAGARHLGRGVQTHAVREALAMCRAAGIFTCYNMLLFEPQATLDDVADNIAFMREHAAHPVNFGRVEAYYGTPLHHELAGAGGLTGSHLGHGYRIADDRVELLFRVCAAAFRQRNWDASGLHNRVMGLGYALKLLEDFYRDASGARRAALAYEADTLTRAVVHDSAGFFEQALELVRGYGATCGITLRERERLADATAELGARISRSDAAMHARLDDIYGRIDVFARAERRAQRERERVAQRGGPLRRAVHSFARGVAAGSLVLALGAAACGDDGAGPVDPDVGPLDRGTGYDAVDPDVGPLDRGVRFDTPLRDGGVDTAPRDGGAPSDGATSDGGIDDAGVGDAHSAMPQRRGDLIDQWHDTVPRSATRSDDLPLFDPPEARLVAERDAFGIRVQLAGAPGVIAATWRADGSLVVDGRTAQWVPRSAVDQLAVVVRTPGGVTVTALRAADC